MCLPSIAAAVLAAMAGGASAAAPASLLFDRVFSERGEPANLHFRASYRSGGTTHHVEVWRDRDRRLKRDTDGALTTYVYRASAPAEYRMEILDHKRRIHTTISRTNLFRIGGLVDWYDLAHGLRHPHGPYSLVREPAYRTTVKPIRACKWFALSQQGATAHICWDDTDRLPLAIVTPAGLAWHVDAIDRSTIAAATFAFSDRGYIRTNADQDMERD